MKLIKELIADDVPSLNSAEKGNELIRAINALLQLQIVPVGYGKLTVGDKNIILDLTDRRNLDVQPPASTAAQGVNVGGSGGGGGGPYPFDVSFVPLGAGTQTASVRPGSVNNLIPSNYLDTYAQNTTGTQYFLVADVTVTDAAVTGVALTFGTSAPTGIPVALAAPPTSFQILIGVVIEGKWYRIIGNGSLDCTSVEAFRVSATSPSPGTLPYDIYYTWSVSNI